MVKKTICQTGEEQAQYMAFLAFPHEDEQMGEIIYSSLDKEIFIKNLNHLIDPKDLPNDEVCICKTLPLEIEVKITNMPEMAGMDCGFLITDDIATLVLASLTSTLKEKLEEALKKYVRNTIQVVAGKELKVELKMSLEE